MKKILLATALLTSIACSSAMAGPGFPEEVKNLEIRLLEDTGDFTFSYTPIDSQSVIVDKLPFSKDMPEYILEQIPENAESVELSYFGNKPVIIRDSEIPEKRKKIEKLKLDLSFVRMAFQAETKIGEIFSARQYVFVDILTPVKIGDKLYTSGLFIVTKDGLTPYEPEIVHWILSEGNRSFLGLNSVLKAEWDPQNGMDKAFEKWLMEISPSNRKEEGPSYYFSSSSISEAIENLASKVLGVGIVKQEDNNLFRSFIEWTKMELSKASYRSFEGDSRQFIELSVANRGRPVTRIVQKLSEVREELVAGSQRWSIPKQALRDWVINEKGDLVKVAQVPDFNEFAKQVSSLSEPSLPVALLGLLQSPPPDQKGWLEGLLKILKTEQARVTKIQGFASEARLPMPTPKSADSSSSSATAAATAPSSVDPEPNPEPSTKS